jgi:hypothetical protein
MFEMHDCQATTEKLLDLTFGAIEGAAQFAMLRELQACDGCRAEYLAYKETLRAVDRAAPVAQPPEIYWEGYQSKLRRQLRTLEIKPEPVPPWWQRLFAASIRVPVPLAAAASLLVMAGGVWAWRNAQRPNVPVITVSAPVVSASPEKVAVTDQDAAPAAPQVIYRDRVVTRTVYLPRAAGTPRGARAENGPRVAANDAPETPKAEPLIGFAPPEKVVLQVTKSVEQEK